MILVIDNYDSFTYNIVQALQRLSTEEVQVIRSKEITVEEIEKKGILIYAKNENYRNVFNVDMKNVSSVRFRGNRVYDAYGNYWIFFMEFNFYGLDYSEREFEEGSTMKYLYDHGVELEEISLGSDATKQVDSILLSCTGDNNNACAYVQKTLAENLFRATIRNAKILEDSYLIIASNPLNVVTSDAYSNLVQRNAPNNFGLDVSNFKNSNKYIGVRTQGTSGAMLEILELWLE